MSSGTRSAAITIMVTAKANAASMNVSSRVISMPRKRKPSSRGSASRFSGRPDAISSSLLLVLNCGGESAENLRRPEAASSCNQPLLSAVIHSGAIIAPLRHQP